MRRRLHRQPELAFREERTAEVVAARAAEIGFRVRRNVGRTGVVAEIGTGAPVIALRADMDALPIQEENDADYRSTQPGVMHACGHDAHMSMLLGAARLIAASVQDGSAPAGTVRLLFQPAEESADEDNLSGAARMIEDGAMDDVAAVFGLHVGAHLPGGKVYVRPGPIMAGSDTITATIHGKSSHAARPHEGVDAVVLAAHVVLACQIAVARGIAPAEEGVLTIGMIQGGVAENVLADRVSLIGTIRYFEEETRQKLRAHLQRALDVAGALGGRAELHIAEWYPPVVNHDTATEIASAAAAAVLGADAVVDFEPMMGAEDFALLAQRAPGAFLWIGAALEPPREHHHPRFDIDESVLPRGAAVLAACALEAMRRHAQT